MTYLLASYIFSSDICYAKCKICDRDNPLFYNGPDSSDGQLLGLDFVNSKVFRFTPIFSDFTNRTYLLASSDFSSDFGVQDLNL